jgi:SAM-dependent methyltransferase
MTVDHSLADVKLPDFIEWWTPERIEAAVATWKEQKGHLEFSGWIRGVMRKYHLSSVIELGCGAGFNGAELAEFDYLGTDGSPAMIAVAKEHNPEGKYAVANIRNLEGRSAELSCSFAVLKHFNVEDQREILTKMLAAGRKYALIHIQVTDGPSINIPEDYNHTWLNRDDLADIITAAGFEIIDMLGCKTNGDTRWEGAIVMRRIDVTTDNHGG